MLGDSFSKKCEGFQELDTFFDIWVEKAYPWKDFLFEEQNWKNKIINKLKLSAAIFLFDMLTS